METVQITDEKELPADKQKLKGRILLFVKLIGERNVKINEDVF